MDESHQELVMALLRSVTEPRLGSETCDMCGGQVMREYATKELFDEQIEYLKELRVDKTWIDGLLAGLEKDEYYAICALCWIKYVKAAVKASSFRLVERREYDKAVERTIERKLHSLNENAENLEITELIQKGVSLREAAKTCLFSHPPNGKMNDE